jgi:osmotically-inducible protein OsmY
MARCTRTAAAVVALSLLSCGQRNVEVGVDSHLEQRVEHDLREEGFTSVLAAADKGIVTLTGFVPTDDDRGRAREVANRPPQVSVIEDRILVRTPTRAAFARR